MVNKFLRFWRNSSSKKIWNTFLFVI